MVFSQNHETFACNIALHKSNKTAWYDVTISITSSVLDQINLRRLAPLA